MTNDNQTLARKCFEVLENGRTPVELFTADFTAHFPGMPPLDAEGFDQFEAGFRASFSGLDHRLHDMVSDGDNVAVRLTLETKQNDDFMGVPNSGNDVAVEGSAFFRMHEGKIAEFWGFMDMMGLMQQIGGIPKPATA